MIQLRVFTSALLLLTWVLCSPSRGADRESSVGATNLPAAIVPLVGEIDDYSRNDLVHRFDKAKAMGAKVIVIDIDSPGGMVTASMEISRFLKRQTGVHTIAFVKEKAYSGAAMVAVACDEIWMAPDSPLGDCAPIVFNNSGGLEALPDTERAKQESPVVDEFVDSAQRNGYDPLLLTAMVSLRNPIEVVQNRSGETRVVREDQVKTSLTSDEWEPAPAFASVGGPGRLVTLYPNQAIALGLAKGQVSSARELVANLHDSLIADLTPSAGEKLIEFFNNPFVRMILLTVFLQSLYIVLHAPGHGAAEAVAVVSLGLLIGVPLLTGYAQWWEVAVIFGGLAFCAFEIFVFPGHFVSLITGTLMIVFGLVMTFVPTGLPGWVPTAHTTWTGVQTGLLAVVGAIICWIFLSMWLRRYLPAIPYFRRLILTATTANPGAAARANATRHVDSWPFVGTVGTASTDLLPGGSVQFPYADATRPAAVVSLSGFVPRGAKVIVEDIQGTSVRVRVLG